MNTSARDGGRPCKANGGRWIPALMQSSAGNPRSSPDGGCQPYSRPSTDIAPPWHCGNSLAVALQRGGGVGLGHDSVPIASLEDGRTTVTFSACQLIACDSYPGIGTRKVLAGAASDSGIVLDIHHLATTVAASYSTEAHLLADLCVGPHVYDRPPAVVGCGGAIDLLQSRVGANRMPLHIVTGIFDAIDVGEW